MARTSLVLTSKDGAAPVAGVPDPALLVVDDNEDNRYVLSQQLNIQGYDNITIATNGHEALNNLRSKSFDLVLLDIMMPDLNGYEVLERMRSSPELRNIPVIMISGIGELDSVVRCIELGAEDYLPKPFEPTLLRARVRATLERKRLHDQVVAQAADLASQAAELANWNKTLEQRVADQLGEIERMGRLRRFLSPQVADLIVASGMEKLLQSHRGEITALFCDLRGFTRFSETSDPEDVMVLLRDYHAVIGQIVIKYGATLEHFAGDGVMMIFNAPVPIDKPQLQAVRMALEMRDAMGTFTQKWRRLGHDIGFGIGISHGFATLGTIGFEGRFDYAAVGTVSNIASRLCDEAKPGQILISPRVLMAVEDTMKVELVGELTLKGIQRPMTAYNVIDAATNHIADTLG
jgi:class 3 adenylate cyclase/AmiR/NasT family two-component response regulator